MANRARKGPDRRITANGMVRPCSCPLSERRLAGGAKGKEQDMAEILVGRPARISIGEPAVPAEVPGSGWAWRFVTTGCRRFPTSLAGGPAVLACSKDNQ
jgi:hypothetical protein